MKKIILVLLSLVSFFTVAFGAQPIMDKRAEEIKQKTQIAVPSGTDRDKVIEYFKEQGIRFREFPEARRITGIVDLHKGMMVTTTMAIGVRLDENNKVKEIKYNVERTGL